jgi:hypothetical protein
MLYMYHFGVWIQETASTSGNANAYLKDNVPLDVHASVRFELEVVRRLRGRTNCFKKEEKHY